jgi:hypothetical protein
MHLLVVTLAQLQLALEQELLVQRQQVLQQLVQVVV